MSINKDVVRLVGVIGKQLGAVVFVQDYLQLQLDGPMLTLTNWPVVQCAEGAYRFGELGYRDALCNRIGKLVVSAHVQMNHQLRVVFDDASELLVSLRPEDRHGPEIVRYEKDDQHWAVW